MKTETPPTPEKNIQLGKLIHTHGFNGLYVAFANNIVYMAKETITGTDGHSCQYFSGRASILPNTRP